MDRNENCEVMIADVQFLHLLALLENSEHLDWQSIQANLEKKIDDHKKVVIASNDFKNGENGQKLAPEDLTIKINENTRRGKIFEGARRALDE